MSRRGPATSVVFKRMAHVQGFDLTIDGSFKGATATQLNAFQKRVGLPVSNTVNQAVWDKLVQPLAQALRPVTVTAADDAGSITLKIAKQHYQQKPLEIGGETVALGSRLHGWQRRSGLSVVRWLCDLHRGSGLRTIKDQYACDANVFL